MTTRFTVEDDRAVAERKARYIAHADGADALGRPVAYYPSIALAVGSVTAAVFFCQLNYWKGKGRDADGWIYKTQDEWLRETGLTRKEQEGARAVLRKAGLIEEWRRDIPAKLYYRVNQENYGQLLAGQLPLKDVHIGRARMPKMGIQGCPEGSDSDAQNGQSINRDYAEITPEITTAAAAALLTRSTLKGYRADPIAILWVEFFGKQPTPAQAARMFELQDIAAGKGLHGLVADAIRATAMDGKGFRWFEAKAQAWITNGGPDTRPQRGQARALTTGPLTAHISEDEALREQAYYARLNGYADTAAG